MFYRVKVIFYSDKPVILPINYNHLLQSYVYNTLTPDLATFLHNEGFRVNKKVFKLFTFSKIFGKYKVNDKFISFSSPFYFYFSTPIQVLMDDYISENFKREYVRIGNNKLDLQFVEFEEIPSKSSVVVKTVSPITVHITEENRIRYFSPDETRFFEMILDNLKKKYYLVFGEEYKKNIEILPYSDRWKKCITRFKNTLIVGWEGKIVINGDEKIVSLALTTGLGSKNSQGFGMVVEDKL